MDNENLEKGIILLVDDTPTNLSVLFDSLSNSGFKMLVALDGESAIEQVDYVVPDLILLDILMPGIDGFETCRRLKAKDSTKDVPIIFMTALTETVDKVKGFGVGAVDYITKPIQTEEVLARVNTHLSIQNLKKALLEQNEQLQQEIRDRQKAEEALRLLLHSVSHDLRNPVTGMSMVLRNLLTQDKDTIPVGRSILERMATSSDRQLNLINSLVEAHASEVRGVASLRKPLQLSQLIQDLVADWEPIFVKSQATLTNLVPAELPLVNADATQLWRVFENLIGNALKHNLPGVSLTITATVEAKAQNYEEAIANCSNSKLSSPTPYSGVDTGTPPLLSTPQKKLHSSPSVIRCTVKDNGIGIEPQHCERLFELYVRGSQSRHTSGLGLGLYLCRQIITAHGGEIAVSSTPGNGAMFWFTLPVLK
jgi:two-component system sensor histidine kinase/response regulator